MKPRNKREKEIVRLSAGLPGLTERQRNWAELHIGGDRAYVGKRTAWCASCGSKLSVRELAEKTDGQRTECPNCNRSLYVSHAACYRRCERYYYAIVTTKGDWQIFRHFVVDTEERMNRKVTHSFNEVVQEWIDEHGARTIVARSVAALCCYYDNWIMESPMSIKNDGYRYRISPYETYPWMRLSPMLKRNGFNGNFNGLIPGEVAVALLSDNGCEYLYKTGQTEMFKWMYRRDTDIPYRYAIDICNRHGYTIPDASLWIDMLSALEYLGKDTHSPHYVCPENLKGAHDKWIGLKRKKEEMETEKQKRKEAMEWEGKYAELKGRFFGLLISDGIITIRTLQSVKEFMDEGKAMHHCVFANGYYKSANSLILSARTSDGERVETVEVNLDTFEVVQSRGVCNSRTDYHDEIVNLVTANMNMIRKLAS